MGNDMNKRKTGWLVLLFFEFAFSSALMLPAAGEIPKGKVPEIRTAAPSSEPWGDEPFTAEPAALLEAAQAAPDRGKYDAIVLLEDARFTYDEAGKLAQRYWLVYTVPHEADLSGWSSVECEWTAWYQERPTIRARVITPSGLVHALDPGTIAESAVGESSPEIYGDRKLLRAPLPAISADCVVEEEVVTQGKMPMFDAGTEEIFYLGKYVPVGKTRVVVEAPASLPLKTATRLLPSVEVKREESNGKVRVRFTNGPMSPIEAPETYMPGDIPQWPAVAFSTGDSWARVAARYSEIVEEQIHGADVKRLVRESLAGVKNDAPAGEVADKLLNRLHRDVRYTGVELGDASIIPRAPAETLHRKFGDCKDQAALLTAMLRSAGIPAHVALLRTRPHEELEADLPGFGWFNHAIVFVPGPPEIWIDPSYESARAGEIPIRDQGRFALIASPSAGELVRTPESQSSDNRTVETREFYLAERGSARVVETTEVWGSPERALRSSYSSSEKKDIEEALRKYVDGMYASKKLASWEMSDPKDLSVPFRMRLEALDASRGVTDENEAAVAIFPGTLSEALQGYFPAEEDEAEAGAAGAETGETSGVDSSGEKKRARNFEISEPYSTEWKYRIVPPPGYRAAELPPSGAEDLGTAGFSQEFAVGDDGVVTANLRLDSGKRRLTPDEYESLKKSIGEFSGRKAILIRFQQVGQAYLASGRIKEALQEFQKLVELHPKEALHHTQIALALLAGGVGDAAREAARRATVVEPSSPLAFKTLGWVLQHDLIGRRFGRGFDLEGAVAAYRKAVELDPKEWTIRGNLAILLDYDAKGFRYSSQSNLKAAIHEYKVIRNELNIKKLDFNLMASLMWAGQYEELKSFCRTMEPSDERNEYLVTSIAATEGTGAAIKETQKLFSDPGRRRNALEIAAGRLVGLRFYPEAVVLLSEAAKGSPNAARLNARIDMLKRVRRHEEITWPEDDPASVVKQFFVAVFGVVEPRPEDLSDLLGRRSIDAFRDLEKDMKDLKDPPRRLARSTGIPTDSVADIALAVYDITAEGNDRVGYRLRARSAPMLFDDQQTIFVVREEGKFRILALETADPELGSEVLRRLDRGDLEGARQILDWLRDDNPAARGEDPLGISLFPEFWSKGGPEDVEKMRTAAAVILVVGERPEDAVPILEQARERASSEGEKRNLDLVLARAFFAADRYEDLLAVAQRLGNAYPESAMAFLFQVNALSELGRYDALRQVAEERLERVPDDRYALGALVDWASKSGDVKAEQQYLRRIVDSGKATDSEFNRLAWNTLFEGGVTEKAIEDAQRASSLSKKAPEVLHTLAALYAEMGKTAEARETILDAIDGAQADEPRPGDWYVFGRIAEQYGVRESAIAAYKRVEKPERGEPKSTSAYMLARKRLRALEEEGKGRGDVKPGKK
jgi:tetratricopeptide (TPR) repeat protein